jgi:hypothetical protein
VYMLIGAQHPLVHDPTFNKLPPVL